VFYFPRSNRELWANSDMLKHASPYFKTLLESGFRESRSANSATDAATCPPESDWRVHDSDDEADQVPIKLSLKRTTSKLPPGVREVVIKSAAYTTYRSVLTWLCSGYLAFAPLSAAPLATSPASPLHPAKRARLASVAEFDSDLPLPASPKSVYALAHLLELPDLMRLALSNFTTQLTADNALYQLLGEVAVHDEVRDAIATFAKANWAAVKASKAATELSKTAVLESLGCGVEEMARLMELMRQC
jgi:hypothetical protein